MNASPLAIAIDGPVASGKGEIASRLATQLDLLYIYTGAMYRALALACIEAGIPFKDEKKVVALLEQITIDVVASSKNSVYPYTVLLNGKDVTDRIIKPDTAQGSSDVGSLAPVRKWMVERQKEMAKEKRVVMEGRDIALRVLPDAQLKIYLTASVEARAQRRFDQWRKKGIQKTLEETIADVKTRDQQDMTRDTDPLQKVPDAWELDTTNMSPEEVIDCIKKELQQRNLL
jgi:CMP/dCMP kinase